jgi:UDP-GlcNAc:undecaprenyl-phosphate GlcNAc-1-phosphate transferase
MNYVLPALSAFGLTFLSILIALKVFPKIGLMDRPKKYGLKRKPIPYPGGILLYFVFLAMSLIFFEPTVKLMGLLVGGGLLVLINFIDDRMEVAPWIRLLAQVVVGIIMVAVGIGIEAISNPFGGQIPLNEIKLALEWGPVTYTLILFSALFTVIWIVLVVNTMNWLDGIPGLVSGITVLASLALFFLSISGMVDPDDSVATMAIIVAMIAFAFWIFDFYPPKILLGDSGAMFFGLLIAVMAIFSGGKIATAFLILGFAILDALFVVVYRLFNKKAPWKGGEWDKYRKAVHLHHRLLQFGMSERQVLVMIYVLSAIFGFSALFLGTRGKFWAIVLLVIASFVLGLVLKAKRKVK